MSPSMKGKVAVITGGAGMIGHAAAMSLATAGADVMLVDINAGALATRRGAIEALGVRVETRVADVSKPGDVAAYVAGALQAFGRIDAFFNNAGIEGKVAPIAEYDEAVFDQVIGVNVKGVFLGLRHVLPVMLKQKAGAIVNTASVAGLVGSPGISAYVASKHAVIGLTKTASGEVARSGIRVNAICPGPIDTRMIHSLEAQINPADPGSVGERYQASLPIGRYGTVEEVANLVLFLCSDLAGNITGGQYVVDGGRTATGGAITTPAKG